MPDKPIRDSLLEDMVEFVDNPEPRCPCVLLLDVSYSMEGPEWTDFVLGRQTEWSRSREGRAVFNSLGDRNSKLVRKHTYPNREGPSPIRSLNDAVAAFKLDVTADSLAALRADIAVVAFDDEPHVVQDFVSAAQFEPVDLTTGPGTNISAALVTGLDMVEERKRAYRANGIAYYRPIILLLTDGEPQESPGAVAQAARRVLEAEQGRHAAVFAYGVGDDANIPTLSSMMAPQRPAQPLRENQLRGIFQWLANSVSAISSSQPGDRIRLPNPEDYLDF